ncbi:uncharacterized protein RCC_00412 [Ramularia collo-cygni]|uniref:Elongator complex protein 5 n=1 Tax=Ramularia collo-cygni TaxID=112498 RepID=A0A2D3UP25_9PEZI|nr:uncharacterized protein RCC_00412 [Ramularia collo-cygni]CZT14435.1 uncharacterized protein RCC_00412 [Ramularia collo-cygni]
MSAARSQPPALEPYLNLPPEISLTLLTGTLGFTATFLASRYVGSVLHSTNEEVADDDAAVLLVSWMRDAAFWKNEIRRGTGLDVSRQSQLGKFAFVDCFSNNAGCTLVEAEKSVLAALSRLSKPPQSEGRFKKITLLLDSPDILLATSTTTAAALSKFLLTLRSQEHVQNTILSLSADSPFLSAAVPGSTDSAPTPIEVETAAFITSQAHAAQLVLSVRGLDTGAATDVSGVLRATRGGDCGDEVEIQEGELLYLMQRDGNVKVFERGSG